MGKQQYKAYIKDIIANTEIGMPIYNSKLSEALAAAYKMKNMDAAAAATSVAIKRIKDNMEIPELQQYRKGIYYRSAFTVFGQSKINKEQLIADKYILPNNGYETGLSVLHRMGLTSQMPRDRVLVTNVVSGCMRTDKELGVKIKPPKIPITADNKKYFQILDVLDIIDKAPIDVESPYTVVAEHIRKNDLKYEKLLSYADKYYPRNMIYKIAKTASEGGENS